MSGHFGVFFGTFDEEGQATEAQSAEEDEYEGTCEYTISPPLRKALNQELSTIMSIVQDALPKTNLMQVDKTSHAEKAVIQSVKGKGGRSIRRMLDLHTSKRLANNNTQLVVRLFGIPKLPTKAVISHFLSEYSATALKKSEKSKMYVATLPNYKQYDRICKLGSVMIGGFKLQIKPLHLSGPKIKPLRPDYQKKKNILGSIYDSVQTSKNQPPSKNAPKASNSKEFRMDEAIVLDEVYDEEIQLEDLEDY